MSFADDLTRYGPGSAGAATPDEARAYCARLTASLCGGSGPLTAALEADLRALAPASTPSAAPRPGGDDVIGVGGPAPWPWLAGGAVVLVAGALAWRRKRRRVLSGK